MLEELTEREDRVTKARDNVSAAGTELQSKRTEAERIEHAYQELYRQEPRSFDHHKNPLDPKSDAAKLAAQLEDLDLPDAEARYQHPFAQWSNRQSSR